MSDAIHLPTPDFGDDGFGWIHGELAAEIEALRCVGVVMRAHSKGRYSSAVGTPTHG
jgi:hypothetical protein